VLPAANAVDSRDQPTTAFVGGYCKLRTPHPSDELTKTAEEASHTDAGITDGDPTGLKVIQREDEDGASGGEESAVEMFRSTKEIHARIDTHRGAGLAMAFS